MTFDLQLPNIPFPNRKRQSFGVSTASAMLEKAVRDFRAFQSCTDVIRSGDHAFNVCLSIWHLHDWAHADATETELEIIGTFLGRPVRSKTEFSIALQRACPLLKICRIMATAGKHTKVDTYPDPTVETMFDIYQSTGPDERFTVRWGMTFDGRSYDAADVFDECLLFWGRLFATLNWTHSGG
ncbi:MULTISPECIES: hypothetical protein [unclassified Caballeronia]|uniref:hypothetical protein n=1 Tax=unclassified Caballeronia TaxID=2646786 RepID=UPI0020281A92|nr:MULTISPECIES: hypothetical protein [unclassified Caballeronia]